MTPNADSVSRLLLTLYAAPMQPELWLVFLRDFSRLVNLPGASIQHQQSALVKDSFVGIHGVDPVSLSLYERYYGRMNPWRAKFVEKAVGEVAFGDELCAARDLRRTEFYNDYLSKYQLNLSCVVATTRLPTGFEVFSVFRGLHDEMPGAETLATIKLIIPHVRSALQLRQHLYEAELSAKNSEDVLDSLSSGVILLNERNECLFVSRKAETLCAANDGLYIMQAKLRAQRPEDHQTLNRLIDRAVAVSTGKTTRPCGVALIRRRLGAALRVSVLSLSPQTPLGALVSAQVAVVAVFIRSPDEELSSLPEILIATYGVTSAEARICAQLFEGYSLGETAERNKVSRETVRVQLRSIFSKVQVRRQADLLRLCTQLVATL